MSVLIASLHGLDYLASTMLVGTLLFYACIETATGRSAVEIFRDGKSRLTIIGAAALSLSAIGFLLVAADIAESWSPSDLLAVVTSTAFGHWWACREGLLLFLLFLNSMNLLFRLWWVALAVPVFFGLSGHAGAEETGVLVSLTLDYIHLITVALWSGGLVNLLLWLKVRIRGSEDRLPANSSILVVKRFSHFAMVSTALIAITGIVMAHRFGVRITAPWTTQYGSLVVLKVALFTAALGAASINQFVHLKGWQEKSEEQFNRSVYREVHFEIAAVWITFIVAGLLTRLPPPGH